MAFMKRTGGRNKLAAVMVIAAGLMVSGGGYALAVGPSTAVACIGMYPAAACCLEL